MTTTYRSRSPIRDSNTTRPSYPSGGDGRRENWRMRQERSYSRDDSFARPRGERGGYHNRRSSRRQRSRSESESYRGRELGRERGDVEQQHQSDRTSNDNKDDGNGSPRNDELAGDRPGKPERGGYRGAHRRNSRRQSSETERDPRPIVLNPTDVPKAERYFTHDDRLAMSSRRSRIDSTPSKWGHDKFDQLHQTPNPIHQSSGRARIDSTPSKWEHDMFEKMKQEEEEEKLETTPPPRDGTVVPRKSVVSKIVVPGASDTMEDTIRLTEEEMEEVEINE